MTRIDTANLMTIVTSDVWAFDPAMSSLKQTGCDECGYSRVEFAGTIVDFTLALVAVRAARLRRQGADKASATKLLKHLAARVSAAEQRMMPIAQGREERKARAAAHVARVEELTGL